MVTDGAHILIRSRVVRMAHCNTGWSVGLDQTPENQPNDESRCGRVYNIEGNLAINTINRDRIVTWYLDNVHRIRDKIDEFYIIGGRVEKIHKYRDDEATQTMDDFVMGLRKHVCTSMY